MGKDKFTMVLLIKGTLKYLDLLPGAIRCDKLVSLLVFRGKFQEKKTKMRYNSF